MNVLMECVTNHRSLSALWGPAVNVPDLMVVGLKPTDRMLSEARDPDAGHPVEPVHPARHWLRAFSALARNMTLGGPVIPLSWITAAAGSPTLHATTDGMPAVEASSFDDHALAQRMGWNDAAAITPRQRANYLCALNAPIREEGERNPRTRRCLNVIDQSLLHRLAAMEETFMPAPVMPVRNAVCRLDKTSLMPMISEWVGGRPAALVFDRPDYERAIPDLERMLDRGAIYLKANEGFRGENVVRIARHAGGYQVTDAAGAMQTFDRLADYRPPRHACESMNTFLAEAQIPIARTRAGETWELRMLPPFGLEYAFAKLGKIGSIANNIAQGGQLDTKIKAVLGSVIRHRFPGASRAEVAGRIERFLSRASALAWQVKDLTDDVQLHTARAVVRPGDLKSGVDYEQAMLYCFSGSVFCVDITGVWNADDELMPMIIEAQASAGLPEAFGSTLYESCLATLNDKAAYLREALR